MITTSTEVVGS